MGYGIGWPLSFAAQHYTNREKKGRRPRGRGMMHLGGFFLCSSDTC